MSRGLMGLAAACALALSGCGGDEEDQAARTAAEPNPAAVREVIEEGTRRFEEALNRGDAAAAAEIYAEDARLLPPNADIFEGRETIRQFWTGAREQLGLREVDFSTVALEIDGERAYEVGTYSLTVNTPDGGPALPDRGKYVVVWEQQDDATWRWATHAWNSSLAPPRDEEEATPPRPTASTGSGSGLLGRPID